MRQYFEMNKENTTYQNLWNAAKSHAQREIYSLQQIYFKKAKKRKAEKLMSLASKKLGILQFKKLGKEQLNPKKQQEKKHKRIFMNNFLQINLKIQTKWTNSLKKYNIPKLIQEIFRTIP